MVVLLRVVVGISLVGDAVLCHRLAAVIRRVPSSFVPAALPAAPSFALYVFWNKKDASVFVLSTIDEDNRDNLAPLRNLPGDAGFTTSVLYLRSAWMILAYAGLSRSPSLLASFVKCSCYTCGGAFANVYG